MPAILVFEDKLGITSGYESIWANLIMTSGLVKYDMIRRNSFRSLGKAMQLLVRKGNRVTPGFNPDEQVQHRIRGWVMSQITALKPVGILCMDPVILFMLNPDWDQATLDTLRGGVYRIQGIPVVVSLPISAWHVKKQMKDIARMNEGHSEKDEWEEEHGGDETDSELNLIWMEPVVVPYGKFVLSADIKKLARVIGDKR